MTILNAGLTVILMGDLMGTGTHLPPHLPLLVGSQVILTPLMHIPKCGPMIIDAGIAKPSHTAQAMELGYDVILLNTEVAQSNDPTMIGRAFGNAINAARVVYVASAMTTRQTMQSSIPMPGTQFW